MSHIELPRFENIPVELKDLKQWVCWKYVERDGRQTKPPFQTNSTPAGASDPETWDTFDNVQEAVGQGGADGIGFVFSEDDPYAGVDLDDCVKGSEIQPWTQHQRKFLPEGFPDPRELVERLDTYAEVSPSGTGMKLICRGKLPGKGRHVGDFEIYDQERYFTVTGECDSRDAISEADNAIAEIYGMLPMQEATTDDLDWDTDDHPEGITDEQIIERVVKDPLRGQLWSGDWESQYGSQSEADLALCSHIAFFVGPYPRIIERIFAESGLDREKWSRRTDYSQRTLRKVLADKQEFYDWKEQFGALSGRPVHRPGRIRVVSASDVKPEEPKWLWPGHMPAGAICEITGNAGLGKSTLTIDIAARVSRGDHMPLELGGPQPEPATVLMMCAEDSYSQTVIPRWQAAGGDIERLQLMSDVEPLLSPRDPSRPIFLQLDLPSLEQLVEEHRAGLLIIDPYTGFIDDELNVNIDPDNRKILGPMAQMAERTGVTVLLVRHLNKREGSSAIHRAGGSVAITAACRASFVVGQDKESSDRRVMACTKMNAARMPRSIRFEIEGFGSTSRIKWHDELDITADQLLEKTQGGPPSQLDRAKGIIAAALQEGSMPVEELKSILSDAEIGDRPYRAAVEALGVELMRPEFGGKMVARLPETTTE